MIFYMLKVSNNPYMSYNIYRQKFRERMGTWNKLVTLRGTIKTLTCVPKKHDTYGELGQDTWWSKSMKHVRETHMFVIFKFYLNIINIKCGLIKSFLETSLVM